MVAFSLGSTPGSPFTTTIDVCVVACFGYCVQWFLQLCTPSRILDGCITPKDLICMTKKFLVALCCCGLALSRAVSVSVFWSRSSSISLSLPHARTVSLFSCSWERKRSLPRLSFSLSLFSHPPALSLSPCVSFPVSLSVSIRVSLSLALYFSLSLFLSGTRAPPLSLSNLSLTLSLPHPSSIQFNLICF